MFIIVRSFRAKSFIGDQDFSKISINLKIRYNSFPTFSDVKTFQLDWIKKEDARAAIRLVVKKKLRGKVPDSELDNLLKEVIQQAEGQYRDWPMEA